VQKYIIAAREKKNQLGSFFVIIKTITDGKISHCNVYLHSI